MPDRPEPMVDDDRDRVSREDDHLRDATVLLDETEVYVVPAPVWEPDQMEIKARYRRHRDGKRWHS